MTVTLGQHSARHDLAWRTWARSPRKPDKEEVRGSSPGSPTSHSPSSGPVSSGPMQMIMRHRALSCPGAPDHVDRHCAQLCSLPTDCPARRPRQVAPRTLPGDRLHRAQTGRSARQDSGPTGNGQDQETQVTLTQRRAHVHQNVAVQGKRSQVPYRIERVRQGARRHEKTRQTQSLRIGRREHRWARVPSPRR